MPSLPLIVGIHGLANKPSVEILKTYWSRSIEEGLRKNEGGPNHKYDFELVYWAKKLYKYPLHRDRNYAFDKNFNHEPYVEAAPGTLKRYNEGFLADVSAALLDLGGETVDFLKERFGVNSIADFVLGQLLKDLHLYYENPEIRSDLRDTLSETLLAHEGRKIMLVAHSMGSVIAYDVLTQLGQSHPHFQVDHFVTIGSPLGLPHVKGKIIEEYVHRGNEGDRVRTPTVVANRWVNFADRKDPVALDVRLGDDYGPNAGNVKCEDDLVYNDYRIKKGDDPEPSRNYHKSYGYLRTPEFSELVNGFV